MDKPKRPAGPAIKKRAARAAGTAKAAPKKPAGKRRGRPPKHEIKEGPDCIRCSAMSKQSGEQCGNFVAKGKKVCRIHGGRTPSGAAAPAFVTGFYSRAMPANLAERYMEALKDPELIELRREAALSSALIERGLARLDTGESGTHWDRLQKAWDAYSTAKAEDRAFRLANVGNLIEEGASAIEAERELRSAIVDKMRVAESERRRLVEASQVITAEELVAIAASLAASVNAEVSDRQTRERILARFNRALSAGAERSAAS